MWIKTEKTHHIGVRHKPFSQQHECRTCYINITSWRMLFFLFFFFLIKSLVKSSPLFSRVLSRRDASMGPCCALSLLDPVSKNKTVSHTDNTNKDFNNTKCCLLPIPSFKPGYYTALTISFDRPHAHKTLWFAMHPCINYSHRP